MTRNVLVTGANGFIGHEVALSLERIGWCVVRGVRSAREGQAQIDLEDPMLAAQLLRGPRMDAIVHLAAKVGWSGETPAQLFIPNVVGTANLLAVAKSWDAHFVFSSAAIVCGSASRDITSTTPPRPDMPYSESKWLAEQLITASGVRAAILRIAGVFGADGPGHLGLNRAVKDAIRGQRPKLIGDGNARRNYIYVKDLAEDVSYTIKNSLEGTHCLAGSEVLTISQMLNQVCEVFLDGQPPDVVDGLPAKDQIIERSPGFPPTRRFKEAILDIQIGAS